MSVKPGQAHANARSRVWYSRPEPEDHIGTDYDEPGHITAEGIAATGAPTDSEFYLCGPTSFMTAIRTGLDMLGVPTERVHTEDLAPRLRSHRESFRTRHDHLTRRKGPSAQARSCRSCGPA
jgi:ferredoxin-NADP reductase